jgi:hypothetical protein
MQPEVLKKQVNRYKLAVYFELLMIVSKTLLADAEVGEDFTEDGVGGDFAGDFA